MCARPPAVGAVWTLGCLRYLSEAEAASVTLFETVGCLGVMERDQGSPYPEQFPSQRGKSFPLYDAVSFFTQFKGGKIRPWFTEDPLKAIGFELIASDQSKTQRGGCQSHGIHASGRYGGRKTYAWSLLVRDHQVT